MTTQSKLTVGQALFPVSLLAFVIFLFLGFQTSEILRERDALHAAKTQQDKPVEDAQKVQTQLDALAVGTLKLSQSGDKSAIAIIDRMKQLGITVKQPTAPGATPTTTTTPAAAPAMAPAMAPAVKP